MQVLYVATIILMAARCRLKNHTVYIHTLSIWWCLEHRRRSDWTSTWLCLWLTTTDEGQQSDDGVWDHY